MRGLLAQEVNVNIGWAADQVERGPIPSHPRIRTVDGIEPVVQRTLGRETETGRRRRVGGPDHQPDGANGGKKLLSHVRLPYGASADPAGGLHRRECRHADSTTFIPDIPAARNFGHLSGDPATTSWRRPEVQEFMPAGSGSTGGIQPPGLPSKGRKSGPDRPSSSA